MATPHAPEWHQDASGRRWRRVLTYGKYGPVWLSFTAEGEWATEIPERNEIRLLRHFWIGAWSLMLIPYHQFRTDLRKSLIEQQIVNEDGAPPAFPARELVEDVLTTRRAEYWIRLAVNWAAAMDAVDLVTSKPLLLSIAGLESLSQDLRHEAASVAARIETS